ncbi:unnamed protein product [Meganyctiphanes norvegica]|uniref:RNA-binding protein lark-like n=1 Tax=Meganyctiphanes norvegica TaxID=48144 RepID=A0AAV2SRR9_MEGNR
MPVRGNTFKIFIGNLSDRTTGQDLRELFEEHGTVVEADAVEGKNFGFVHMEKEEERKSAIDALNGHTLHGREISVEASKSRGGNKRTKIFIGNLHKDTTAEEIRELFEAHGKVNEADVLGNYSFVHMDSEDDARRAIESLDGTELHGLRLRVQESTSRVRKSAGMGDTDSCYRCGSRGHWSKDCRSGPGRGGGRFGGGRFDSYGGPPPRGYERDRMMRGMRDDPYDRYGRYGDDPYSRRPLPPRTLPPMRDDPYDRRPIPRMREDPYERRPIMPPMRDDLYERRLQLSMGMDYMSLGRRSRSPPPRMERDSGRYPPPPPPPMRGFLPAAGDRRPY